MEFQRALELTSLGENSFMNMCIVAGPVYLHNRTRGSVFLLSPCFVAVVSI